MKRLRGSSVLLAMGLTREFDQALDYKYTDGTLIAILELRHIESLRLLTNLFWEWKFALESPIRL